MVLAEKHIITGLNLLRALYEQERSKLAKVLPFYPPGTLVQIKSTGKYALVYEYSRGDFQKYSLITITPSLPEQKINITWYASAWFNHEDLEFISKPDMRTLKLVGYYNEVKSAQDDEDEDDIEDGDED